MILLPLVDIISQCFKALLIDLSRIMLHLFDWITMQLSSHGIHYFFIWFSCQFSRSGFLLDFLLSILPFTRIHVFLTNGEFFFFFFRTKFVLMCYDSYRKWTQELENSAVQKLYIISHLYQLERPVWRHNWCIYFFSFAFSSSGQEGGWNNETSAHWAPCWACRKLCCASS